MQAITDISAEALERELDMAQAEVWRLRKALGKRNRGAPHSFDHARARELWATGATLDAVGQAVGCSRERIRQLVKTEHWPRSVEIWTRKDLVTRFGPVAASLPFKRRFKGRLFGPGDQRNIVAALGRLCPEPGCDVVLGLTARKRCPEHAAEQYRHRWRLHMTPTQRAHHLTLTRAWKTKHPVQWKEINERAQAKYHAKRRANRPPFDRKAHYARVGALNRQRWANADPAQKAELVRRLTAGRRAAKLLRESA